MSTPVEKSAAQRRAEVTARKAARRAMRPAHVDPHQLYSIEETGAALDASRAAIYNLISAGKLQTVKLDGRARVSGASIIRAAGAGGAEHA
jgi:hypothetical protein